MLQAHIGSEVQKMSFLQPQYVFKGYSYEEESYNYTTVVYLQYYPSAKSQHHFYL